MIRFASSRRIFLRPLRNRLMRLAAFQNPEFYKSQSMRVSTWGKPRIISCVEDHPRHLALPRGCVEEVEALLSDLKIKVNIRDDRVCGEPIDVCFQGQLRPEQKTAARSGSSGFQNSSECLPKTSVGLAAAARSQQDEST